MLTLASKTAAALGAALLLAGPASAVTIDFSSLPDQNGASIAQSSGGIIATARGFGGIANPNASLVPTNPTGSGATDLGVNVGGGAPGSGAFSTHGVGCGTVTGISQCDLISPGGEDALLITFSVPVTIGTIVLSAIEDFDDVTAWTWSGASWSFVGDEGCGVFSFCGGEESIGGSVATASKYLLLVAENTDSSAFRLTRLENVEVPAPGSLALFAALAALLAGRRAVRRA